MAGLQPDIWVGVAIPWLAALGALILRVMARRMVKVNWWFDDYFAILAFLFATGYCGIMLHWTMYSYLGVKIPDSMPTDEREAILEQSRFLSFFNSICYASSIACSKIAILCLYWRLFRISSIRIPILVLLCVVVVWIILRTFMLIFRCVPVQSLWDYSITDKECNIDSGQFFLGTITTHFILDLIILGLPLFEVFHLRMRIGQKLAVAALFLLGIIVCMASAFVLAELVTYDNDTKQMPYDYAMFCVWGSVEVNIAVVSACFPLLRPILSRILPARFLSSYGSSSHPISRSTKNIRLTTLGKSNKGSEGDETSSTRQLAVVDHEFSSESSKKQQQDGVYTVISSQGPASSHDNTNGGGIVVQNSTVFEVIDNDSRV